MKNAKKKVAKKKPMSDREFAVILEKIYSELKVLGEGQGAIREKLDSVMGMVAKNREDLTSVNFKAMAITGDITKINGKLAQIEEDVRIIKHDLKVLFDKRLSILETKVAALTK